MKTKHIILGLFCLLNWEHSFAEDVQIPQDNARKHVDQSTKVARPDTLHALYSYTDFTFNETDQTITSHFQGHSNFYLVGGNNFPIYKTMLAGIFIYRMDTNLTFTQSALASTKETIHNNTIIGHVLKQVKPSLYFDVLGGYGQNQLSFKTLNNTEVTNQELGHAVSSGNSWFVGLKGIYSHSWTDFGLISSLAALHTEVNQNAYNYILFNSSPPNNFISPLSSKATFILENAELTYKRHATIQPFLNGALIQIVQKPDDRPNLATLSIGSLPNPNININKNGFAVGGGVSFKYKKLLLRLEQQYYQRGSIYHSNQSVATIRYAID